MKKILTSFLLGFFASFIIFPIETSLAAESSSVVGFEILAPASTKANEAIDITVRAIDKDKKTVADYQGSIIFISDTFGDVVPSPGKAIRFTPEDAGQKKFSKGVIFRSIGKQKIYVADVDNSNEIVGETTVTVDASETITPVDSSETVTVVTPAQDTKITGNTIAVSGKTKKNSKVLFLLNGIDVGTTITDESGLFTKTLSDITQERNILQVNLVDGTNKVIAKSSDIVFEKAGELTGFYNIVISPNTTVETSSTIDVLVEGDPAMESVSIEIDSSVIPLIETAAGKYTTSISAPATVGSFPINVTMSTALGQKIEKPSATTLFVVKKPEEEVVTIAKFSQVKVVTEGKKAIFTFSIENTPSDLDKFKIAYGPSADSLNKEVITFAANKIQTSSGVYSWYLDNLDTQQYTFKIFGMKTDGSLIAGLMSDPLVASIAIPSCSIGNVGNISVSNEAGKSILTWNALTGAKSYNIYRVTPAGDNELIQNVTETKYVIYQAKGDIKYDDFVIKALCDTNIEANDMSRASRVQTGPGMVAILIIISAIMGVALLRNKSLS